MTSMTLYYYPLKTTEVNYLLLQLNCLALSLVHHRLIGFIRRISAAQWTALAALSDKNAAIYSSVEFVSCGI